MPRRSTTDWGAVDALFSQHEAVARHSQLIAVGVKLSTITRRIGPRGPWQRAAPGVVIAHRGTPTRRERILAALVFAGDGAIVTGLDALHAAGGLAPDLDAPVHVLVPETRQRKSFAYIRVERTRRPPSPMMKDGIPFAPAARATVDACRFIARLDDVRDLVASTVQWRRCSLSDLTEEIRRAARQRTALSRAVLREVDAGIRSVSEARAREIFDKYGVPCPLWNVDLLRPDGSFFLRPDAFWPSVAAALEIDSLAWHLAPASYRRTKARERRLILHGVLVLAYTPAEILDDPEAFAREVIRFLDLAARRPVPAGLAWRPRVAA